MRLTNKLYKQHLDWWFKQQWKRVGQRVPIETGAQAELERLGFTVIDAKEAVKDPPPVREKIEIDHLIPPPTILEAEEPAYLLRDENVLLEGVAQAQALIKTIQIDSFPASVEETIEKQKTSSLVDRNIRNAVLESCLFDSEQKKLAIEKVPDRPSYVLPRKYGITDDRKNRLITSKLIFECEKTHGRTLALQRRIAENLKCHAFLDKEDSKLQLDFNVDTMILSKRPLGPISEKVDAELPNLYPLKSTVSIPHTKRYKKQTVFPIRKGSIFTNPHTIVLHFSPLTVRNLHETPVTDGQFQARNILKAFSVAATRAKQLYGENATNLEKPVVVQSVQTDGKLFHFGVYQLNTLNIDGIEGVKNYWFQRQTTELYHECTYDAGRPVLRGFNEKVFNYLNAFYSNN